MNWIIAQLNNLMYGVTMVFQFVGGFLIAIPVGAYKEIIAFIAEFMTKRHILSNLQAVGKSLKDFESVGTITAGMIQNSMSIDTGSMDITFYDREYKLYKKEDITWFLSKDNTNEYAYIKEINDCDDFAEILKGRLNVVFPGLACCLNVVMIQDATGVVYHAVNGFIDENRHHNYIEPQTDGIFSKPANWTQLKATF